MSYMTRLTQQYLVQAQLNLNIHGHLDGLALVDPLEVLLAWLPSGSWGGQCSQNCQNLTRTVKRFNHTFGVAWQCLTHKTGSKTNHQSLKFKRSGKIFSGSILETSLGWWRDTHRNKQLQTGMDMVPYKGTCRNEYMDVWIQMVEKYRWTCAMMRIYNYKVWCK